MNKTYLRLNSILLVLTTILSLFGLIPSTAQSTKTTPEHYTFSEDVPFIKVEDENGIHFYGPTGDIISEEAESDAQTNSTAENFLNYAESNSKPNLAPVGNCGPLPSSVDNSQSEYFPAINDQKGLGACVAFATHYQFTYHINKERGVATTPENTFSPKWIYNHTNHGENDGTHYDTVYRFLQGYGCVPLSLVPYDDTEHTDWHAEEGIWKEAMKARIDSFYTFPETGVFEEGTQITSADDPDLLAVKTALAAGDVLTYSTHIHSWDMNNLKTHPDAPENNKFENEYALKGLTGHNGPHRMAIVGYNDGIWVDINENNQVDAGETGAFKIVNSWSDGYCNDGFAWVAYDALNDISCVEGAYPNKRERAFTNIASIKVRPYEEGTDAYVEFTANTADRTQLDVYVTAEKDGVVISHKFYWGIAYISENNRYGFNGKKETSDGTITYCLDNIVPDIKASEVSDYSWDIRFVDREDDASSITIKNAKIVSEAENLTLSSPDEYPFEINNSEKTLHLWESDLENSVIYYIGYEAPTLHYKDGDKDWEQVKMEEKLERLGHNYKYVIENSSGNVSVYFTDDKGNIDNNGNCYVADKRLNFFRTTEGNGIKEPLTIQNADFSNGMPDTGKLSRFDIDVAGGYEPYNYSFLLKNKTTGSIYEYDYNQLSENAFFFSNEGVYEITINVMDQAKDVFTYTYEYDVKDIEFIFKSFGATSDEKIFVGNEITFIANSDYEGVYSYAGKRNKYDFVITDEKGNICYKTQKNSDVFSLSEKTSTTSLNWTPAVSGKYSITISSTDISKHYAEKTFDFEAFDKIYGDADGSNVVNVRDATLIQKKVAELPLINKFYTEMADCDLSTDINIKDATLIQKYLAAIDPTGEVGNIIEYIPPVIPTEPVTEAPSETPTEEPTTPTEPENNTVIFTNSLRWSGTIYCYYWSDSNAGLTSWPGSKMQFVETNGYGEDIYRFEVPKEANRIIFTNSQHQTADITYPGGEIRYYAISDTDSKGAHFIRTW